MFLKSTLSKLIIIMIIITIIIYNNNDNNNKNNNDNFPETRKYWTDVQRGNNLISWEERSSLALVGSPSRDGVSINILVCGGVETP